VILLDSNRGILMAMVKDQEVQLVDKTFQEELDS
jgi:hypothetical protein